MRIKIRDMTPVSQVLVLAKYSDTLGTALLTRGWN